MNEVIEEITKLTDEWYFLIGKDHHKDRDCHWYIEVKWSYGYSPKYTVQHWGYLASDIEQEFNTYEEALTGLKGILEREIHEYKSYKQQDDESW